MKQMIIPFLAALLLSCGNPSIAGEIPPGAASLGAEADAHSHTPAEEDNTMEHDAAGYCGNTVTTVSYGQQGTSFWGSDSVALTDLLRYLDYSGETCGCPVEYTVDTEFGTGYGISLSGCFVRHDNGQAALTAGQAELVLEIFNRQDALTGEP